MGNFHEVSLIILSLFANLELMSDFYSWKVLLFKLKTFKNCKEVKHIMIMVIAIIYIFFILCDIWSTVSESPHPTTKQQFAKQIRL